MSINTTIRRICLLCSKELYPSTMISEADDVINNGVNNGVQVVIHGNYGSAVWDPIGPDRRSLVGFICDTCLLSNKDKLYVTEIQSIKHITHIEWEPE